MEGKKAVSAGIIMTMVILCSFALLVNSTPYNGLPTNKKPIENSCIVEFKEPPLLEKDAPEEVISTNTRIMESERQNVLDIIDRKKIEKDFRYSMNAIVVNLTDDEVKQIESDENVKKVYKNSYKRIHLDSSIPVIDADEVWKIRNGIATEVHLQTADTENLDDVDTFNIPDYTSIYVDDDDDGPGSEAYIKFNTTTRPTTFYELNSSLCWYVHGSNLEPTDNITIYGVSNYTWTEETGIHSNMLATATELGNYSGQGTGWKCFDVSSWIESEYLLERNNITFGFDFSELSDGDSIDDFIEIYSKEYATSSLRPYLNITYYNVTEINITGVGIEVAVLDTGVNYSNTFFGSCTNESFLAGNCSKFPYGWDFVNDDNDPMDDYGHGTHVSGIIALNNDPSGNLMGVAPNTSIVIYKVCDASGNCADSDIISAIENATAYGVDVISMSFGGTTYEDEDALKTSLQNAYNAGIILVASAGNEADDYMDDGSNTIGCPACLDSVIAVGASAADNSLASFSSRGFSWNSTFYPLSLKPDIIAPGTYINSTYQGTTNVFSGTSMAAPHITGVIALMKQMHPNWSKEEIKSALMNSATEPAISSSGYHFTYNSGSGRVNALNAVNSSLFVTPYKKMFRYSNESLSTYQDEAVFILTNNRNYEVTYNLTFNISSYGGNFSGELNVSTVTIPANDNVTIKLNITVNESDLSSNFTSLSAKIYINSVTQNYVIPIAISVFRNPEDCDKYLSNGLPYIIDSSYIFNDSYCYLPDILRSKTFFIINGSNTTIDCNGSSMDTIYKPSATYFDRSQIFHIQGTNNTLKNCNLLNSGLPVMINSSQSKLYNTTIHDTIDLVQVYGANSVTIENCTFLDWSGNGIQIAAKSNFTITRNNFFNSSYSEYKYCMRSGNNQIIDGNTFARSPIEFTRHHNVTIQNNMFLDIPTTMLDTYCGQDFYIINNTINTTEGSGVCFHNLYTNCQYNNTYFLYDNVFIIEDYAIEAYALDAADTVISILMEDCLVNVTQANDIYIANGNLTMRNVTFNDGYSSWLYLDNNTATKQWWVVVNVTDTSYNPISSATVTSYMNGSGGWVAVKTNNTDVSGISRIYGNEFIENDTGLYYYKLNVTANKNGYAINSSSFDSLDGNLEVNIILETINDTTPPVITVTNPKNTTYSSLPVNINVTTSESADWCGYDLGDGNVTLSNDSTTNWFGQNNSLSNGTTYHLIVYCNDTSENIGVNNTIYFTYINDTTAPTISSVSAGSITTSSATITWTTDEESNSSLSISPSGTYSNSSANTTSHSIAVSGLSEATLYTYSVISCDPYGNCASDTGNTFTTTTGGGGGGPGDCTPDWQCTSWGNCVGGVQTRTCVDNNDCDDNSTMPETVKNCTAPPPLNLTDINLGNYTDPWSPSNGGIYYPTRFAAVVSSLLAGNLGAVLMNLLAGFGDYYYRPSFDWGLLNMMFTHLAVFIGLYLFIGLIIRLSQLLKKFSTTLKALVYFVILPIFILIITLLLPSV